MNKKVSYKNCLNCQTELKGDYCHVCGQKAINAKPTVKEFFLEYVNIVFIWDTLFFRTLWQLLRRPGHVTKEYVSGKFVSYTHPLKLNMFLMFVFITAFLIFHKDFEDSVQNITRDEAKFSYIQMRYLQGEDEYAHIMKSSPKDTVRLYAPLMLAESFPDLISDLDSKVMEHRDSMVLWTASLPHFLIEEGIIKQHPAGYYQFVIDGSPAFSSTVILEMVWKEAVKLTSRYFPICILLTVPFLVLLLRLTQRKGEHTKFKHFIFALHYTAFLEIFLIAIYFLHLIAAPPVWIMQWLLLLGASAYLALAIKSVYDVNGWLRAIGKAVLVNVGYILILMALLCLIIFVSCVIVSFQLT
jgi:hypothetical protein